MSLIYPLKKGPEEHVLTDEGYFSNNLRLNIRNNFNRSFELSQSYLIG